MANPPSNDAVDELLAQADDGPIESGMTDVYRKWKTMEAAKKPERMQLMLAWAKTETTQKLGATLHQIITDLASKHNAEALDRLKTMTFARFIHQSNSIEGEGPRSLDGTTEIIRDMLNHQADGDDDTLTQSTHGRTRDQNIQCVWNTYSLMVETYHPKGFLSEERGFLNLPLRQYHKDLFNGEPKNEIRKCGVMSRAGHKYPHHRIVPGLLSSLLTIVSDLAAGIVGLDDKDDPVDRILYVFALAAFTHFHLVSIHPFKDGNGRLARFVSKLVLDAVLPAPFPYDDQHAYMKSLADAAGEPGYHQPIGLYNYMMKTAHEYYVTDLQVKVRKLSDLTNHPETRRFVLPVTGLKTLQSEFEKEVQDETVRASVWRRVEDLFATLKENKQKSGEVQTEHGIFLIAILADTDDLDVAFDSI